MSTTEDDSLKYAVEGRPDGDTLLFVHGWPDDASVWRYQVEKLKANYRCVLVTLPNFGDEMDKPSGYDFPALITMLDRVVDKVQRDADEQVVLVTHDWGAYLGYLYEQASPDRVRAMIAMDIGGHFKPTSAKATLMILGYQWTLVLGWLTGRLASRPGDWLTRQVAKVVGVPGRQFAGVRARYNYLYYYFWRATLLPSARANLLARYRPKCPVLYLYGSDKPVMFHSERWLQIVGETGGQNVCVNGAGHWFMETHAEQVNELITSWGPLALSSGSPRLSGDAGDASSGHT